MQKLAEIDLRI